MDKSKLDKLINKLIDKIDMAVDDCDYNLAEKLSVILERLIA